MPSARSATSAARASGARSATARSGTGRAGTTRAATGRTGTTRAATGRAGTARAATARAAEASPATPRFPRPRHVPLRSAAIRVRWERVGRIALLVVLAAVVAVYAEHAVAYLSARGQNASQQAIVRSLEQRHAQLQARERALQSSTQIVRRARQLGMTRTGEQPYAITGKPSR